MKQALPTFLIPMRGSETSACGLASREMPFLIPMRGSEMSWRPVRAV